MITRTGSLLRYRRTSYSGGRFRRPLLPPGSRGLQVDRGLEPCRARPKNPHGRLLHFRVRPEIDIVVEGEGVQYLRYDVTMGAQQGVPATQGTDQLHRQPPRPLREPLLGLDPAPDRVRCRPDGIDAAYERTRNDPLGLPFEEYRKKEATLLAAASGQGTQLIRVVPSRAGDGVGMPEEEQRHLHSLADRLTLTESPLALT